jgi:hypothetical protein
MLQVAWRFDAAIGTDAGSQVLLDRAGSPVAVPRETPAGPERRDNAPGKRHRQHHPATSGDRQKWRDVSSKDFTREPPKSGTATGSTRDRRGQLAWHGSWHEMPSTMVC